MLGARQTVFGIALLLAAVSDSSGQSKQPPQTPGIQTDQQSNNSGKSTPKSNDQINHSANPTTTIPIAPSSDLQKETTGQNSQGDKDGTEFWPTFLGYRIKITDSLLAAFTLLLVFIGAWQGGHLRATVKSFIRGERPYIYPGVFNTSRLLPSRAHAVYPLSPDVPFPEIDWAFMNVGKSPGIIKEIRGELFLGTKLPRRPTFTYSKPLNAELVARADKETDLITFPFNRNLTVTEINEIGVGTTQFCFFGYVKYTDSFRSLHTKGFAFRIYIRPHDRAEWPAPGSEDTELGVLMEPEVGHGETEVYPRVQA
jgi:hypothetical protein